MTSFCEENCDLQPVKNNNRSDDDNTLPSHGQPREKRPSRNGKSELHKALKCRNFEEAEKIARSNKAYLGISGSTDSPPLLLVVWYQCPNVFPIIAEKDIRQLLMSDSAGFTAFLLACFVGNFNLVKECLQFSNKEQQLNATTKSGYNCLHLAVASGFLHIVKYLLKCRKTLLCCSTTTFTVIDIALMYRRIDVLNFLVDNFGDFLEMTKDVLGLDILKFHQELLFSKCDEKSANKQLRSMKYPMIPQMTKQISESIEKCMKFFKQRDPEKEPRQSLKSSGKSVETLSLSFRKLNIGPPSPFSVDSVGSPTLSLKNKSDLFQPGRPKKSCGRKKKYDRKGSYDFNQTRKGSYVHDHPSSIKKSWRKSSSEHPEKNISH